ncbi:cystathionine gamma-synthase, partial [Patellaria atrata CBS 101060]
MPDPTITVDTASPLDRAKGVSTSSSQNANGDENSWELKEQWAPSTLAVHADDAGNYYADVAPAMHVSTTFRYDNLEPVDEENITDPSTLPHIYSRLSSPTTTRLETLLSALLHGHAITYTSGLSALHALLVHLSPRVIAIRNGYHGSHGVLALHRKLNPTLRIVDFAETAWDAAGLGTGDLVHLETPLNPTGEASDIAAMAARVHARGAYLCVDSTFGPPGLQDPFEQHADVVLHSGTKYLGGHSDMLCGVLVVRRREWWAGLVSERVFLGSVMGGLEAWLGVRSLRTLELRVRRQSESAEELVAWLAGGLEVAGDAGESDRELIRQTVARVQHSSLQPPSPWLKAQMPHGGAPVFALTMRTPDFAKRLPGKLKLFHHATSLGGVESLIEWRRMSDKNVDPCLLRVSVGVESWEDLRGDLRRAMRGLVHEG